MNYYNEFNPESAAMIRQMMADGLIPEGHVDERSIKEVQPDDLRGYTQCHFFAGIGGWSFALQIAGWPEDRPVWTGSCPCQPFSSAGRQKGKDDDRHLWPEWERLISECRPERIYGEQVATAIAKGWLDDVYQGLETQGYAIGAAVLPACSVGAPHKRDRLWFVANRNSNGCDQGGAGVAEAGNDGIVGNNGFMVNGIRSRLERHSRHVETGDKSRRIASESIRSTGASGFWNTGIWTKCPDGKQRFVECRFSSLDYGVQSGSIGINKNSHDPIQKEKIDANAKKAGRPEALPVLRYNYGQKTHERTSRGFECIPEKELLQPVVCQQSDQYKACNLWPKSKKTQGVMLRDLPDQGRSSCSPQGSGYKKQRSEEFADVMRFMSLETSLGERRSSEAERILPLQDMYIAFAEAGLLPKTLSEAQEIWRSIIIEKREQIVWNILGKRSFFWEPKPLLAIGQLNRRPILHAIGNAVVPALAAEFIKATM